MSSRLERLAAQSPAATAAPAPPLDADDFSAQAPDGEQVQAQAQPDPGQYAPVDAQGIAEAVVAAMPQPQYVQAPGRNGRRAPVRVSVPRDPLDKFFSTANTKRLEVYRLVAEPDGMEKPHHAATFNGSDAAGFASLADFVRQRVSNRSKRYGGYRCIAKDASGAAVATEDVYIDAPLDATPATGGTDSSGNPIYGAVSDILRTMAGHTEGQQGDLQAQLRGLLSRVNQPGSDNASLYRELADLRVKIAEGGSRQDTGPMSQVVPLLLKRLDEADRRNAVVAPAVDVERVVERALAAAETRFQAQISALRPAPDPVASMAAMMTAMATVMSANKGPDVAALITALRPDPVPPPPPPVAQPDAVDTLIKFTKAREALDGPRQEQPDVLEQITKIATVHAAIKNMGGGDASGGNWAGVFGQLVKGGSDMIKEGSKALDKRIELEKAQAERAKMQTVATVVQAKAATGAPMQEVARVGAEAAAAVQQVAAAPVAAEPAPAVAAAATVAPTASKLDVFAAVQTLGASTTDTERVRSTLALARVVEAAMPEAKAGIRDTFARAASGDRSALNDLRDLLTQAVAEAGLPQTAADATLAAFEKHWDTLVARGVFGRPANGAGTTVAAPAPVAPATANGQAQQAAA